MQAATVAAIVAETIARAVYSTCYYEVPGHVPKRHDINSHADQYKRAVAVGRQQFPRVCYKCTHCTVTVTQQY